MGLNGMLWFYRNGLSIKREICLCHHHRALQDEAAITIIIMVLSRKEAAADNDAATIGSYYAQTQPIITPPSPSAQNPRSRIVSISPQHIQIPPNHAREAIT